jgi:hypothetical protein
VEALPAGKPTKPREVGVLYFTARTTAVSRETIDAFADGVSRVAIGEGSGDHHISDGKHSFDPHRDY